MDPEQSATKDFRNVLRASSSQPSDARSKSQPEQLDFRSQLKKKSDTKVNEKFNVEQKDFRSQLKNKTDTQVGKKVAVEQKDFRDSLSNKVKTKVGQKFDAEQVDYRMVLNKYVHPFFNLSLLYLVFCESGNNT